MSETTDICPNCGAARPDRFCGACGQSSRHYLRATWDIVVEVLRESFDLDSRLARTAYALVLRPGTLTREFLLGRRASYVSPVRLYLAVSIVFFAVLSISARVDVVRAGGAGTADSIELGSDADIDRIYAELNETQRQRVRSLLEKHGRATDELSQQLDSLDESSPEADRPVSEIENAVHDRVLDLLEDPGAVWQGVINDLPVAMFLMLPLYAAWLKLMYRRRFYAEHLVFALHLHAFLFLVGTLILLLPDSVPEGYPPWLRGMTIVGVVGNEGLKVLAALYYLLALRAVYGERMLRTLGKFVIINAAHFALIGFGVSIAAVISLALP